MRRFLSLLLASSIFAPSAFAQEDMSAVQVRGVQPVVKLQEQQAKAMAGVYKLDNGGTFRLTAVHRTLLAQLNDGRITQLLPTGDQQFYSREQRMTVEYIPQAFGDTLTLTYPLEVARADSPMVQVRLAVN